MMVMDIKAALERFKNHENIVIHTPTEEIAIKFLEWCEDNGIAWVLGDKATKFTRWNMDKEKTCYRNNQRITHASISWFKSCKFEIFDLSLEDILSVNKVFEND